MICATTKNDASRRQRGAALFMALIFLLILTLLGVFSMRVSRLENMMAGNSQFQATALSNAELGVVDAERELLDSIGAAKPGCYYPSMGTIDPATVNWPSSITATACTYTPPEGPNVLYVIEYAGEGIDIECSKARGKGGSLIGCIHYDFVLTAQAETSRGAKRTVQTVYQSASPP